MEIKKNKISDYDYDAQEILLSLLDMDKSRYLVDCGKELESLYDKNSISNIITQFDELINARSSHFPLQYILGEAYFCGLKINQEMVTIQNPLRKQLPTHFF